MNRRTQIVLLWVATVILFTTACFGSDLRPGSMSNSRPTHAPTSTKSVTIRAQPTTTAVVKVSSEPGIVGIVLSRELTGEKEPLRLIPNGDFASTDDFCFSGRLVNNRPGMGVEYVWYSESREIARQEITSEGNEVRLWGQYSIGDGDPWPEGQYSVKIYLDGKLVRILEWRVA